MAGLVDGLGFEEVPIGSPAAGGQVTHPFFAGSLTVSDQISGAQVFSTGSVVSAEHQATTSVITSGTISTVNIDYADKKGVYIDNIPAEAIISGGMWVVGSAASGTTPSVVAKPLALANGLGALGVCLADTASGSNPEILIRGFYKGLIAESTVEAGDVIEVGAGAATNCVKVATAGSARGTVIMGAGSEGTTLVYLY